MKTFSTLLVLAALAAAAPASAACRAFGTQIECDLGNGRIALGTQTAAEPGYAGSIRPQPFHGSSELLAERPALGRPLQLDLQNVGADPRLCRRIGNETYCY
jgi:hypothetical protein